MIQMRSSIVINCQYPSDVEGESNSIEIFEVKTIQLRSKRLTRQFGNSFKKSIQIRPLLIFPEKNLINDLITR